MNDRTEDLILKNTARACDAIFGPRVEPDLTAADLLAFLDAQKCFIELDSKVWNARISFKDGAWRLEVDYTAGHLIDMKYSTLKAALAALPGFFEDAEEAHSCKPSVYDCSDEPPAWKED